MKRFISIIALITVSMFLLIGCGGPEVKDDCLDGAPKWVDMGSAAYPGDGGRAFYGVGQAPKSKDRTVMRERAKMRATADVASQFETYVAQLKKDYVSSTSDGDAETLESQFEMVSRQVTKQTLSGIKMSDTYRDKCDGSLHVLVKMDLNSMKDALEKAKNLNAQVKEYISKNADRLHDELKAEEEKH